MSSEWSAPAGERPIRILTWNLWAFDTDRDARRRGILRTLAARQPDVCCLQEVRDDRREDLGRVLGEELGLGVERTPPLGVDWWRKRLGDDSAAVRNVVLSRWPTTAVSSLELPRGDQVDEGRSAILVRIASPAGPLLVVDTQLTSAPWASSLRSLQVRALAEEIMRHRTADDALIVAGDLNAEPDSDEVRLLCGHKTPPVADRFVLMDAWRFAATSDAGWTWDRQNPHVEVTGEPSARIDYVLVGPFATGRPLFVESASVVGPEASNGRPASDHYAVEVDISLPG